MVEALYVGAIVALGGSSGGRASEAYGHLADLYRGRAYHNLHHIKATLETYLLIAENLPTETGAQITLALCYHDAVYDSQAKDNEAKSAELAEKELAELGIAAEDRAEVARLIQLTKHHQVADRDEAGAIVVDADLAILQTSPDEYDRYATAIREEYSWVPDEEYRAGRTKVLEGLLSRRLFSSPLLDEELAKANLRREVDTLLTRSATAK